MNNYWKYIQTSIFTEMTKLTAAENAINLAQGFPDCDGPSVIKEAAVRALYDGHNQYAPAAGVSVLREAISEKLHRRYGVHFCPQDEITIFSGATEALFCAMLALLEPGEEVLCFAPYYDSYPACVAAAHGVFKTIPLLAPQWNIDFDRLEKTISSKTKVLLCNSPHNPTGKVFSQEEINKLIALVHKYGLYLVTDEVYEELIYDGMQHFKPAVVDQTLKKVITISSTSKTYSMTGWKVGYAIASAEISRTLRNVHQFTVFCSATPLQYAMVEAFKLPTAYYDELRANYNIKREYLCQHLTRLGFKINKPAGTYFLVADFSGMSAVPDLAFAQTLTREAKVSAIPVSSFMPPEFKDLPYIRFAFCKDLSVLQEALHRLEHWLAKR